MINHQQKIYQERISANKVLAKSFSRKLNLVATIRTVIFISTLIASVYWANERQFWHLLITVFVGLVAFIFFLDRFIALSQKLKYHRTLVELNEDEISLIDGSLKKQHREGMEFLDQNHSYAYDMDIFGPSSVFSLLNRTSTQIGKAKLAGWLLKKAAKNEIYQRQEAVKELKPLLDWRQDFQAQGRIDQAEDHEDLKRLLPWLKGVNQLFLGNLMTWGSKVGPLLAITSILIYTFSETPFVVVLVGLLFNLFLIKKTATTISDAVEKTDASVKTMKSYARLMAEFEKKSFQSTKLQQLQAKLLQGEAGSQAIDQLSKILYHLERRKNAYFYALFVTLTLYDLQWMIELEKWKQKHADSLDEWLEVIAQVEALQSFAGFAFANEDFTFPEIIDKRFSIEAKNIGHPLLPSTKRVCNDFQLTGKGKTAVITGSNMSGKSTFERTLGVNMILAFAGAPVCADQFRLSLFDIFTSMRVQDSLEENVSGFYAELRRIEQLLKKLEDDSGQEDVFYLLDEVLKGTNSIDRQNGARALIRQLAQKNAFGLISTHDLELGELEEQFPDQAQNFSFNSQVEGGKLSFSYKISRGVCHSFSATKLMQSIGIEIEESIH